MDLQKIMILVGLLTGAIGIVGHQLGEFSVDIANKTLFIQSIVYVFMSLLVILSIVMFTKLKDFDDKTTLNAMQAMYLMSGYNRTGIQKLVSIFYTIALFFYV